MGVTFSGGSLSAGATNTLIVSNGTSAGTTVSIGSLTGVGSKLVKKGDGKLVLNADNSYSGGTQIDAGQVEIGTALALGTGDLTVNEGALDLSGFTVSTSTVTLGSGSGTITSSVAGGSLNVLSQINATGGASASTVQTLDVLVGGSAALVKSGAGQLVLTKANTYSGGTQIKGGQLEVQNGDSLGSGLVSLDGGNLATGTSTTDPLTLNLNGLELKSGQISGTGTLAVTGAITASGPGSATVNVVLANGGSGATTLSKSGSGVLVLNELNTYSGDTTVTGGTILVGATGALNGGTVTGALGSGTLILNGGGVAALGTQTIFNPVSILGVGKLGDETGVLTVAGTVTVGASGSAIFVGDTKISRFVGAGGVNVKNAIVSFDSIPTGTIDMNGGKIQPNMSVSVLNALEIKGASGVDATKGKFTTSGSVTLQPKSSFEVVGEVEFSGKVSGPLDKVGSGNLTLSAANANLGVVVVGQGTITAGAQNALGTQNLTIGTLGTVALPSTGYAFSNPAGVSSGPASAREVVVNGKMTSTGVVTFEAGTALKGKGEVAGDVVLSAGAAVAPGNSPGALTVKTLSGQGDSQWERTSTIGVSVAGAQYDQLIITNGAGSDLSGITVKPQNADASHTPIPAASTVAGTDSFALDLVKNGNASTKTYGQIISATGLTAKPKLDVQNTAVIQVHLEHSTDPTKPGINLVVDRSSYAEFVNGPGTKAFGSYLNSALGAGHTDYTNANSELGKLLRQLDSAPSASEVGRIMRANDAGAAYASAFAAGIRRSVAIGSSLDGRLEEIASAKSSESVFNLGVAPVRVGRDGKSTAMLTPSANAASEEKDWTAWVAGYATSASVDSDSAAGFGASSSNDSGATVGIERVFGNLRVGLLGSYGQGDASFDDQSARVKSDHWTAGGYGSVSIGAVTVDASALFGSSDDKSTRGVAKADFGTKDTQLGAGIAINLLPAKSGWQLMPVARLKYVDSTQDAFTESGSGLLYKTGKISDSAVLTKLGLRVARKAELSRDVSVGFDGAAYWVHDFDAAGRPVTMNVVGSNTSFESLGRKNDADTAQFNLGVHATFSEAWTVRLSGQQDMGSTRSQSAGVFSIALSF